VDLLNTSVPDIASSVLRPEQTRVSQARELLEATKIPIEGVATATGFGSAEALRHHFRRRPGMSPAQYRVAFRTSAFVTRRL